MKKKTILPKIRFSKEPTNIVRQLVRAGYEAYIVGGAVRDYLLGKQPKDYDIATSATPEQVRHVFGRRHCQIIGRRFRLALVHEGRNQYEVSTFRREPSAKERKGRFQDDGVMIWNDNAYGTIDDDVQRRDFTVNALYADVMTGEILDKCGGMADIRARKVRTIGDASIRFMEDPVRMLRALKLVGQHGCSLSRPVSVALHHTAEEIGKASKARMLEEIMKILTCGHSMEVLELCHKHRLLKYFWGGLEALWGSASWKLMMGMLALHDDEIRHAHDDVPGRFLGMCCLLFPYFLEKCEHAEPVETSLYDSNIVKVPGEHPLPFFQVRKLCSESMRSIFRGYVIGHDIECDLEAVLVRARMILNGGDFKKVISPDLYSCVYELLRLRSIVDGVGVSELIRMKLPCDYDCEGKGTDSILIEEQAEELEMAAVHKKTRHKRRKNKKNKSECSIQEDKTTGSNEE